MITIVSTSENPIFTILSRLQDLWKWSRRKPILRKVSRKKEIWAVLAERICILRNYALVFENIHYELGDEAPGRIGNATGFGEMWRYLIRMFGTWDGRMGGVKGAMEMLNGTYFEVARGYRLIFTWPQAFEYSNCDIFVEIHWPRSIRKR